MHAVPRVEFPGLCCNLSTSEIFWQGSALELGRVQRQVLVHLLQQAPAMVSCDVLVNAVWGDQPPATDSLRSHVYGLRTSLKNANVPVSVDTVHGEGYRLIPLWKKKAATVHRNFSSVLIAGVSLLAMIFASLYVITLVRLEDGMEKISLNHWLDAEVQRYSLDWVEPGSQASEPNPFEFDFFGPDRFLHVLIHNLITNALDHAAGPIHLHADQHGLSIDNPMNEESRSSGGYGYGLIISERICECMHWQLDVTNDTSRFTVTVVIPDAGQIICRPANRERQ